MNVYMRGVNTQVGPELELPGYGCEDHFQELDTVEHCWECIAGLLVLQSSIGHAMLWLQYKSVHAICMHVNNYTSIIYQACNVVNAARYHTYSIWHVICT